MKTKGKAWQLVLTVLLIAAFVYTAFFGVAVKYGDVTTTYIKGAKDIRFGVDIKGGVNVTFVPSDGYDATDDQLEAAQLVIENRLVALNVTDYELYVDNNSDSLILEFPWQSGETEFDPEAAIEEIGTTAYLTFREGSSADGELILDGSMIESAAAQYGPVSNGGASEYFVSLKFTDDGAKAFGDATTKLAASGGTISIWLDDENVSTATVNPSIFTRAAKLEGKLVPVVKLVTVPSVYMVHPSMGVKDFQGFMAKVKAKPGDYSVGVPGLGTLGHLMMASFNETLKTDIQIVPYRGNGPALNDALAGMVQVMADQLPSAMPHIKGGKLVPMALYQPTDMAANQQVANRCANQALTWLRQVPELGEGPFYVLNATPATSYHNLTNPRGIGPNQREPAFDHFLAALDQGARRVLSVTPEQLTTVGDDWLLVVTEHHPLPGEDFAQGEAQALVRRLSREVEKLIVVALRSPYDLLGYPDVRYYLCSHSARPESARAAAKVLNGTLATQHSRAVSLVS